MGTGSGHRPVKKSLLNRWTFHEQSARASITMLWFWSISTMVFNPLVHNFSGPLKMEYALSQRVTGIPVPVNSRENQLNFFPLDLEKLFSFSRSRLETWDWWKNIPVLVSKHEIDKKYSCSRLGKWDIHSNLSRKKDILFQKILKNTHLFLENFNQ